MKLLMNVIGLLCSAGIAVKVLHIDSEPTRLMLFFGWVFLGISFIELGMLMNNLSEALQNFGKTERRQ
jgi:hypothetical protein